MGGVLSMLEVLRATGKQAEQASREKQASKHQLPIASVSVLPLSSICLSSFHDHLPR